MDKKFNRTKDKKRKRKQRELKAWKDHFGEGDPNDFSVLVGPEGKPKRKKSR